MAPEPLYQEAREGLQSSAASWQASSPGPRPASTSLAVAL